MLFDDELKIKEEYKQQKKNTINYGNAAVLLWQQNCKEIHLRYHHFGVVEWPVGLLAFFYLYPNLTDGIAWLVMVG
jgi:hypothetical protein